MQDQALLIVRADAGTEIGTKHVMRAIALGSSWERAGGKAILITSTGETLMRRAESAFTRVYRIGSSKRGVLEIAETIRLIKNACIIFDCEKAWVALDGSHFNEYYQAAMQTTGYPVIVFDDHNHLQTYNCDLLVNSSVGAEELQYSTKQAKLLLGPSFFLLRDEFLCKAPTPQEEHKPLHLLLAIGGTDHPNLSQRLLKTIEKLSVEMPEVHVVVGAANRHYKTLRTYCDESPLQARLVFATDNMPRYLRWADAAVTTPGLTCSELCYFGIPSGVIALKKRHVGLAKWINQSGAIDYYGRHDSIDDAELARRLTRLLVDGLFRQKLRDKARCLFDSSGAERLFAAIRDWELDRQQQLI